MIKISNLTKKYGDLTAVDQLNFEIQRNEIFGMLGPNGAGKTTIISMICGLLPPTSGTIQFENFNGKDHKSLIGYCPQENIFYPKLTCYEQLMFIGEMYDISSETLKSRAVDLLQQMGLTDKMNVRASKLSGGMKRRLNICLALIHNPEILILDEPEAGLDPQSRILVRDFIKTFGKEKTIILSTHNMDEADRIADKIAIIDYGKLLLLDTPQNLKKSIGEGDMLEIRIENATEKMLNDFAEKVSVIAQQVKTGFDFLLIKHTNLIEQLSLIKKLAEEQNLKIAEIKLRDNTLEDVFIHLTGRNLRI